MKVGKSSGSGSMRLYIVLAVVASLYIVSIAALKKHHFITPSKCNACAACVDVCPVEAISKGTVDKKTVYIIDPAKCTECGACVDVCPEGAIILKTSEIDDKAAGAATKSDEKPAKETKKKGK